MNCIKIAFKYLYIYTHVMCVITFIVFMWLSYILLFNKTLFYLNNSQYSKSHLLSHVYIEMINVNTVTNGTSRPFIDKILSAFCWLLDNVIWQVKLTTTMQTETLFRNCFLVILGRYLKIILLYNIITFLLHVS